MSDEPNLDAPDGVPDSPSDVESAFAGDEPALVAYVTAGDPGGSDDGTDGVSSGVERTEEYVRALERGGADAIELGLPFSEPIAEGPTIQGAIRRSLDAGMTPDRFFDLVSELDADVPLLVMTYYNLVFQYGESEAPRASERGVEPFAAAAADAGLSGIVVPDLPVDESDPLREACERHGLDLVFIVAPTTRGERLDRIAEQVSGFAYVQARLGTTGAREDVSGSTRESLARLEGYDVPKAVGFGVSEREHAREIVAAGADGVIAGSAFVEIVADGESVADRLTEKASELKSGALDGARNAPESERT